jgi:mannitol/fructose-specific phosphotransferase system IIA component (Ntr-type)
VPNALTPPQTTSTSALAFGVLRLVNRVMLFLVPQDQFQKHLHTLANIAKLLHQQDFRDGL